MLDSIHGIEIDLMEDGWIVADQKKYLDFTSGIFAANLGHSRIEIVVEQELVSQRGLSHLYNFGSTYRKLYLGRLCKFTGFEAAWMFSSGTEATEAAWKIARQVRHKEGIWALEDSFHGKTFGAQIMAGKVNDWRRNNPGEAAGALIFEPYTAHTAKFHSDIIIQNIIDAVAKYDLILIADEIQAGFGRTGKLFGYQHYQKDFPLLQPDIVCIGKGMTNGFPASAILGPKKWIDDPRMELSSTNGGHPLACAAGLATIEVFEKENVIEQARETGEYFQEQLRAKLPCRVQGRGMVAALFFNNAKQADDIVLKCRDAGLLVVHTMKHTVKLGPPLIMPRELIDEGINILKGVIK